MDLGSKAIGVVLIAVLSTLAPSRAEAADGPEGSGQTRLAVAASARPMAIGRFNLLLGVDPGVMLGGAALVPQATLPLRFGITDDLELFAGPVAQTVDPVFHDPALGVLYRFLQGPVEVGARAAGDLSLFGQVKSVAAQLGVPVRIHAGQMLAFDVGAHALVSFLPQGAVGVVVPVGATINVTDGLFAGAASGLRIQDLSTAGTTLHVPLSATVGYTIASGNHPFIELAVRAAWDDLQALGAFSAGGAARIYLYF